MAIPRRIGRYRLIQRIGRGGMGEVYMAQLEAAAGIRRLVAIKLVLESTDDAKSHAALLAEARLSALLSHPNVVQMFDAGIENGTPWFAMEFVPGLAFSELLALGAGNIPPWVSARIVADACAGVNAVHQAKDEQGRPLNIVHRDVTPHNVLVSWDGIVKLADFGVARSSLQSTSTQSGVVKGKLGYMSPEQAGGAPVDRRSDIFALGILLWEALAGRRLFHGATDSETVARVIRCDVPRLDEVAAVPASLAAICARALAHDPAARFSSALDMQRAIDAAMGEAGVVIGSSEVAQVLAHVAPDRVREHERWLRDGGDPGAPPSSRPSEQATLTSIEAQPSGPKRRSVSRVLIAMTSALAAAAIATTLIRLRPESPSTPLLHASSSATHVGGAPSAPVVAANPPAVPTPAASEVAAVAATVPPPGVEVHHDAPKAAPKQVRPAPVDEPTGSGTLNISASPTWAAILVDGKSVGSTPTVVSDVRAGTHVVEALPLGKGPAKRRVIAVTPSATARVEFVFD